MDLYFQNDFSSDISFDKRIEWKPQFTGSKLIETWILVQEVGRVLLEDR